MRATAAPLASSASTSLASSRGSPGSRARAVLARPPASPLRSPRPRAFFPRASLRLGTVSRDRPVARAADTPSGAPLEIDDGADVDAPSRPLAFPPSAPTTTTSRNPRSASPPRSPRRGASRVRTSRSRRSSAATSRAPSPDARPRSPPATPSSSACPLRLRRRLLRPRRRPRRGGAPAARGRWTPTTIRPALGDAYARARLLVFLAGAGLAGVSTYLLYVLAVPSAAPSAFTASPPPPSRLPSPRLIFRGSARARRGEWRPRRLRCTR